ncbi:MAG: hypothetical protein A2293_11455 [Elusimicrobia bacterium RIFOXYB2_FULL_49_7]|nr:MAG: hypothetical protein A2293_11455 [Elusimicrobia bacterium RIFOXYB2_FULL_49_7]
MSRILDKQVMVNLTFEVREDGVYLTIPRDAQNLPSIEELKQTLESRGIMNYNLPRISDVIQHPRGIAERVGDPFRVYNKDKDRFLRIIPNPDQVKLTLFSTCEQFGLIPTEEDILFKLRQLNITNGIDREIIKDMIHKKKFDTEMVVASSVPALNGVDAKVDEKICIDSSRKPREASGAINLRDLENLTQVKEGDTLAVKVLPTPGRDGVSVFGTPIKALSGKDQPLHAGENVKVSDDGNTLVAGKSGFVYRGKTGIAIGDVYAVKGDLDFSVGNLNYNGDIIIEKNVLPDFEVKGEKDITILGQADACVLISKDGSIHVNGGFFGMGKGRIEAAKDFETNILQEGEVVAGQRIRISKYAMNSKMTGNEKVECREVVGGETYAYGSIEVVNSGSVSGVRTLLSLIDRERESIKRKKEQVEQLILEIEKKMRTVEIHLKNTNKILAHTHVPPTALLDQIRQSLSEHTVCKKKDGFLREQLEKLKEQLQPPQDCPGFIRVEGACRVGSVIRIMDHEMEIKEVLTRKEFRLTKGEIVVTDASAKKETP